MKSLFLLIFFSLFLSFNVGYGQVLKHEIGVSVGAVSIQSDYGESGDFASTYGNIGFGAGLAYFVSFGEYQKRWNDKTDFLKSHFRAKLEASYLQSNFIHKGKRIEVITEDAVKSAALTGSTKIYNFGGQLEYTFFGITEENKFEPYMAIGGYYALYNPELTSSLGDWKDNPSLLPNDYLNGSIHLQKDSTQSITFGLGTRYKINNFTMLYEIKWQRFLTDNIDGFAPLNGSNKSKDWLFMAQIGAVFKLN
jgi:hypothetical protein